MNELLYNMGLIALFSVGLLFIFVIWAIIIVFLSGAYSAFKRERAKRKTMTKIADEFEQKLNAATTFVINDPPNYDDVYRPHRPENFHDN